VNLYVYTYAPWFAYLWVPLTYLPRELVETAWLSLMLGCVGWLTYPLLHSWTGALLAMLIVPQVIEYAWIGNVDPLMLVGLALVRTRGGPVLVGFAASLKITPIAFAVHYVLRGEWKRAAVAVAIAVALWAPIFLFDLSVYGQIGTLLMTTPYSLLQFGPLVWIVGNALALGAIGILAVRRRRFALVASAAAAMLANPRMSLYAVGFFLIPARAAICHMPLDLAPSWGSRRGDDRRDPRGGDRCSASRL
jgi:hypothetical protein